MAERKESTAAKTRAFGNLLAECHRELYGFIFALVQHHADADDVYQQVAIVLWRRFDEFERGTNFAAWATRVAHFTARDFIRRRRRNAVTFSDEVLEALAASYDPNHSWRGSAASDALESCLGKLTEDDRRFVEQCYAPNRDYAQIASERGRSVEATYKAISRLRKILYLCVKRTLAQEGF